MRTENFIAFFTVCGFFIGLICGVVKFDDPFMLLGLALFTTYLFYILIHIIVVNFIDPKKLGSKEFDKNAYEESINDLILQIDYREAKMEMLFESVEEELALIASKQKATKKYAKAA